MSVHLKGDLLILTTGMFCGGLNESTGQKTVSIEYASIKNLAYQGTFGRKLIRKSDDYTQKTKDKK